MPTMIVCPNCRRSQVPLDESGQLVCAECSATLTSGLHESGSRDEPADPRSSTSALDFPTSGQPRPSGSITLLRSGLRSEEKNQQGGWMEGLFARRGKTPSDQEPSPVNRVDREPDEEIISPRSSTRSTRIDSPFSAEEPSRPAPDPADRAEASRPPRPTAPSDRDPTPPDRIPIAGILAFLLVAAISTVALLRGWGPWANSVFLLTVFLLGVSILGLLQRQQARRAFWQGFALFGWGYLAMSFMPWAPHQTGLELPTSQLLTTLHAKVAVPAEGPPDLSPRQAPASGVASEIPGSKAADLDHRSPEAASMFIVGDLGQFLRVGHCLFALSAALLGSVIARWFHRSSPAMA